MLLIASRKCLHDSSISVFHFSKNNQLNANIRCHISTSARSQFSARAPPWTLLREIMTLVGRPPYNASKSFKKTFSKS